MKTVDDEKPVSTTEIYVKKLIALAKDRPEIIVLDADLMVSNKTNLFAAEYPDRTFNVGIAEQDLMGISAGLAISGKIPYCSSFSAFATMRSFEQIRTDIAYHHLNVRVCTSHCGCTCNGGATHASVEDIGLMRLIPGMTVIAPGDPMQMEKILDSLQEYSGPVYIRMGAKPEPLVYDENYDYEIGKGIEILSGKDLSIFACGSMVYYAVKAAKELQSTYGISAAVYDMHTIKPLDTEKVIAAAKRGPVVTVEDHYTLGGLGSAVVETIALHNISTPIQKLGIPQVFVPNGLSQQLYAKFGIDTKGIVDATYRLVQGK
ncbi:MAG: transketolase family protein [Flexilinea sp.]